MNKLVLVGCSPDLSSRLSVELDGLKAEVEAEFPDVFHAIESLLLTLSEPRTFLFHLKSPDDLPRLRRLSDSFAGHPIVALVEGGIDPALLLQANRVGAAQVVPLPLKTDDFLAALKRVGLQFGGGGLKSEVVAVAGVTGGCGATAIASNLAFEIAHRRDGHCVLVELSLQLGKLANYFDVAPEFTTQDLFGDIEQLDVATVEHALTRIDEHFAILAGPYRELGALSVSSNDMLRVIHYARRLTNLVVLDVPCTLDEHYFQVLNAADRIVLVSEQKIPSLRSLKLVCDALDQSSTVRPRTLVINRYNPGLPGFSVKKLEEILKTTGFRTISNDYAAMNATLDHGRPLRLEAPRSHALADITALARVLFPEIKRESDGSGRGPFFASLGRRLGLGRTAR